jgi:signal peptidase I
MESLRVTGVVPTPNFAARSNPAGGSGTHDARLTVHGWSVVLCKACIHCNEPELFARIMLFVKWFTSRTVRHAWQAAKHVEKILQHQRDLLSSEAVALVQADIENVRSACQTGNKAGVTNALGTLEKTANKWLKPYPNSALRENIEVALVAIAVAMAIRTFFLQPFKIPTGSMQPTLYGVTDEDLRGQTAVKIPGPIAGFFEYWFNGVSYQHVVAKSGGQFRGATEPTKLVLFNLKQTIQVGDDSYTIWFPPDGFLKRAGLVNDCGQATEHAFKPGEDVVKLRTISGDHLFVDRVSYNFRRPTRGDIVVFETHGIARLSRDQQDTYYIKRLCGLGGETLRLKQDTEVLSVPHGYDFATCLPTLANLPAGHLVVDGREITAATPHFENVYSFPGVGRGVTSVPYAANHFHGHGMIMSLASGQSVQVPPDHYFVMGDNTFNSSDSRYWGDFEQKKVIGKSFFVYWPIGGTLFKNEKRESRFGWAHR